MVYRAFADLVVLVHFGFVFFSVLGGTLAFRWKRIIWFHLPAAFWAIVIEMAGLVCPLTPLEIWLRQKSGMAGYSTDFLEHYIFFLLYPANLTRSLQIALGFLVLAINLAIYGQLLKLRMKT